MLLSTLGVDHLLVSALPTTSTLPKAHVLNQRTMEILDEVGVADAIAAHGTPAEHMAATAFYAGLAGPTEDHGRLIAKLQAWGAGGADEHWRAASAWRRSTSRRSASSRSSRSAPRRSRPGASASVTSS